MGKELGEKVEEEGGENEVRDTLKTYISIILITIYDIRTAESSLK